LIHNLSFLHLFTYRFLTSWPIKKPLPTTGKGTSAHANGAMMHYAEFGALYFASLSGPS
jgi:hypothetical protein